MYMKRVMDVVEENYVESFTDDKVIVNIRALKPQLNHEIIKVLVPRRTKLYDRYIRRFMAEYSIYAEYSN